MKIMVVDDEEDIRWLFEKKFRQEIRAGRLQFHFAHSGEVALAHLSTPGRPGRAPNPDLVDVVLILSDINMPGMNGLELLKIIKQEMPHLTVFMITAYDDHQKRRLAAEYGADDYLTKPLDFVALKQKILHLASRR